MAFHLPIYQQKKREEGKKIQYGQVSVGFDMTLIEHTNRMRIRLKYYELHQKPNLAPKQKSHFLS